MPLAQQPRLVLGALRRTARRAGAPRPGVGDGLLERPAQPGRHCPRGVGGHHVLGRALGPQRRGLVGPCSRRVDPRALRAGRSDRDGCRAGRRSWRRSHVAGRECGILAHPDREVALVARVDDLHRGVVRTQRRRLRAIRRRPATGRVVRPPTE